MYVYVVCVTQLVGRQTIDLYICTLEVFVYSIQYPRVVILGHRHTHKRNYNIVGLVGASHLVGRQTINLWVPPNWSEYVYHMGCVQG